MQAKIIKRAIFVIFAILSIVEIYLFIGVYCSSRYIYDSAITEEYWFVFAVTTVTVFFTSCICSWLLLRKNPKIVFLLTILLRMACFISTGVMMYVSWGGAVEKVYLSCLLVFVTGLSGLLANGLVFLIIWRETYIVKNICKILISIIAVAVLSMLIPIKFCVTSLPQGAKEYYIVQANTQTVIGDQSGIYTDSVKRVLSTPMHLWDSAFYSVVLHGLSQDIWMNSNTLFIVYGKANIEEAYDGTANTLKYTIDVTDWDVYGEVRSTNSLRNLFPKKYLTIYDYYWFDFVRDRLFNYLDGATYF